MKSLIINQYTHQSPLIKLLGNTLTGLGWAFWIYLWLPLISAVTILLDTQVVQHSSAASQSILAILTTLNSHLNIVIFMIAIFMAWSILQWIGKYFRLNALQKQHVANYSANNLFHNLNDLEHWQNAQCMVVSHDNENGQIKQIQVLQSLTLSG